jgi:hypothetical protein
VKLPPKEVIEALRNSKRFYPRWSREQRHAWVKGALYAQTLNRAPISTHPNAARYQSSFLRVSGWPHGTKFVER